MPNFLFDIFRIKPAWIPELIIKKCVNQIRNQVGSERVLSAVSGGVDSSVATALVHRAIGDQLDAVFVDTGLLRKDEPEGVIHAFKETLGDQFHSVSAGKVFYSDLKGIIEYISADSPHNALKILRKIKQKASNLYTLPERGRIVPELQDQGIFHYRELIIPPWRLIYRVGERKIFVLSVIDARQNVEDILLKRLIYKK